MTREEKNKIKPLTRYLSLVTRHILLTTDNKQFLVARTSPRTAGLSVSGPSFSEHTHNAHSGVGAST